MKAFFITAGLVAAAAAQNASSTCVSGDAVHMIIARASLEPPGTGVIGNVSSRVAEQLPGSDVVAVEYPATLDNYQSSEAQGVAAMMKLVTSYASQCPDSRMILMGYSQGAQVTADVLCGTMEASFNTTEALSTSIQDKVAAVVLMGDPSKAANQTFLAGTSTKNGIFPRANTDACKSVQSRIVSYCNANDTFCDSGSSIPVHLAYVQNNGTSAVDFVLQKVKAGSAANSSVPTVQTNAAGLEGHWNSKILTSGLAVIGLVFGFVLVV